MGAIVTGDIASGVTMGVGDPATGAAGRGLHALGTKPSSGPLMGTAPGLNHEKHEN